MVGYDLAVILNDKIIFCSREIQYPKFELVIFANVLIKQLAENRAWALHKLIFKSMWADDLEKLLIRRFISEDHSQEVLICILGELKKGSANAYKMIDTFYNKIAEEFPIDKIQERVNTEMDVFQTLCKTMFASMFGEVYEKLLEETGVHESFRGENQIIYIGISTNGLPLASKLYDNQTIFTFENERKKEMVISILSGQLATIAINAFIRANIFMDSIQIKISPTDDNFIFFNFENFGANNEFTMESLCTGDPEDIQKYFTIILDRLASVSIFKQPYTGSLKLYLPVADFFNSLQNKW